MAKNMGNERGRIMLSLLGGVQVWGWDSGYLGVSFCGRTSTSFQRQLGIRANWFIA